MDRSRQPRIRHLSYKTALSPKKIQKAPGVKGHKKLKFSQTFGFKVTFHIKTSLWATSSTSEPLPGCQLLGNQWDALSALGRFRPGVPGVELQAGYIAAQRTGRCNRPVTATAVRTTTKGQSFPCRVLVTDAHRGHRSSNINKQDLRLFSCAHEPCTKAPRDTFTTVKDSLLKVNFS